MTMVTSDLLGEQECQCIEHLVNAFNTFQQLESLHPDELPDFVDAIHTAQRIVMSRPVRQEFQKQRNENQPINDEK